MGNVVNQPPGPRGGHTDWRPDIWGVHVAGMATYGQAVILSRIGNSLIEENQLRVYSKLLQHEPGFLIFARRKD
jgi:hypothetical protein